MYTEDYKFSERLKTLRKSKKLTQVQISELIGVQQGTYSRWENGTLEPGLEFVCLLYTSPPQDEISHNNMLVRALREDQVDRLGVEVV